MLSCLLTFALWLCTYQVLHTFIPYESDHLQAEIRPTHCAEHGRAKGRSPGIQFWSTQSRTFLVRAYGSLRPRAAQARCIFVFAFLQVATDNTPLPGRSTRAPATQSVTSNSRFKQTTCPLFSLACSHKVQSEISPHARCWCLLGGVTPRGGDFPPSRVHAYIPLVPIPSYPVIFTEHS